MQLLLQDKYFPITSSVAFFESTADHVCKEFLLWQEKISEKFPSSCTFQKREIVGTLEEVLPSLLPLTTHEPRKHLFVPTRSNWVACFNNFVLGTDAASLVTVLPEQLQCRALLLQAVQDRNANPSQKIKRRYGSLGFSLHGPEIKDYDNVVRNIRLYNDGGEWVFYEQGTHLPFEDKDTYTAKEVLKRFTFEMLKEYTAALGLDPFNSGFYLPPEGPPAILVEKTGPFYPGMRTVEPDE